MTLLVCYYIDYNIYMFGVKCCRLGQGGWVINSLLEQVHLEIKVGEEQEARSL